MITHAFTETENLSNHFIKITHVVTLLLVGIVQAADVLMWHMDILKLFVRLILLL